VTAIAAATAGTTILAVLGMAARWFTRPAPRPEMEA